LTAKWTYKRQEGIPEVEDARWKTPLVIHRCSQKDGIDFKKVFSPIVRHISIRVLLALVGLFDLKLEQLAIKTTFIHCELKEEIYMKQPQGFIIFDKENLVCPLRKSLYGLKQALR